jgi:hypothetical protein
MSASEEKKCVSVKDLNMTEIPGLPLRYSCPLVCVVLLKSPLKDINEGRSKMFTMTVADKNTGSNIRAVCFNSKLYETMKPHKTYEISQFILKKGHGNKSTYKEIRLDETTHVKDARQQFTPKPFTYDIASILRLNINDGSCQ